MCGLEKDVIGGFNSLINEQKKLEGEVKVTTIFFDTKFKYIHDREDVGNVKELTEKQYMPSGCTALLDCVGNAITKIMEFHSNLKEEAIPEHTIFSIMTDGLENSSREFNYQKVKNLVEKQKEKGWDFIFQAANIDAGAEGNKLGINAEDTYQFEANNEGVSVHFMKCSSVIGAKRKKSKWTK